MLLDGLEGRRSTVNNLTEAMRLRGPLEGALLEQALQMIVTRHESLRTCFAEVEGVPMQVIALAQSVALATEDLRGMGEPAQQARVSAVVREEWTEPFDLARGPVLRMRLLHLGDEDHVLVRTIHHIATDAWSQSIFNRELMVLYAALREGRPDPLPPLTVQYSDFALWQRRSVESGALDEGLAYWTSQLAGIPELLTLPTDRPRPEVQTFEGEVCGIVISPTRLAALTRLGRAFHATLYMTLLAAFGGLLGKYSGQDDVVVTTPIANRREVQWESLIGLLINRIALRVRVRPTMTVAELLEQVRRVTLEAYRHREVPFECVVEAIAPRRQKIAPICQAEFIMPNVPRVRPQLTEMAVESLGGGAPQARLHLDLSVHAWERQGGMTLAWIYNRDLFEGSRIAQLASHYDRLLDAMVADPRASFNRAYMQTLTAPETSSP